MNFTAAQKAWILLLSLIVMSGGAVFLTSYLGGSKLWLAVVAGLINAASCVYHALNRSPGDPDTAKPPGQLTSPNP